MQLKYKKKKTMLQVHNTWSDFSEFTTTRLIMHLSSFLNIENKINWILLLFCYSTNT